jgi:carbamate kinase
MGKYAVIAIGGNAIIKPGDTGSFSQQLSNIATTTRHIAGIMKRGYSIVITHGNGPQVGNILLKNEIAKDDVPPMPMDVCVAESQGQLGYMIQQSMINILQELGISANVTSIITQVVVDRKDYAFENPTKPVGPYYSEDVALALAREKGWSMMEDFARKGYRRVVPSPEPLEIVEEEDIKNVLGSSKQNILIALGGGGIPVIREESGLEGVEAVVDKDLASQLLASKIDADLLIMVTDVEHVAINFGKEDQKDLSNITSSQAEAYLKEGQFPPGSMGPKILAATRFLGSGEGRVIITTPENLDDAMDGGCGTHIVSG